MGSKSDSWDIFHRDCWVVEGNTNQLKTSDSPVQMIPLPASAMCATMDCTHSKWIVLQKSRREDVRQVPTHFQSN